MGLIDDVRKKRDSWVRRFEEHRQEDEGTEDGAPSHGTGSYSGTSPRRQRTRRNGPMGPCLAVE